jgi:predicted dinucleotide-binding enzyme
MRLATEIGFEPVDVGGLIKTRYLEPIGTLMFGLGYGLKMGTDIGRKLVKG